MVEPWSPFNQGNWDNFQKGKCSFDGEGSTQAANSRYYHHLLSAEIENVVVMARKKGTDVQTEGRRRQVVYD